MSEQHHRLLVMMSSDYTTESGNLGKRTYKAGLCYQCCPTRFAELIESGCGEQVSPREAPRPSAPEREQVTIIPRVTRWFTANGVDTHYLTVGLRQVVPSNLAAFLITADYAEAA